MLSSGKMRILAHRLGPLIGPLLISKKGQRRFLLQSTYTNSLNQSIEEQRKEGGKISRAGISDRREPGRGLMDAYSIAQQGRIGMRAVLIGAFLARFNETKRARYEREISALRREKHEERKARQER
jgi:hypothetical protein